MGRRGITSLFLEGGRTLADAFTAAGAIDEARVFVAPILLGGGGSPAATGPARQTGLSTSVETVGEDVLITTRFREW